MLETEVCDVHYLAQIEVLQKGEIGQVLNSIV